MPVDLVGRNPFVLERLLSFFDGERPFGVRQSLFLGEQRSLQLLAHLLVVTINMGLDAHFRV